MFKPALLLLLFVSASLTRAQDFAGTWHLKSGAAGSRLPQPAAAVMKIEHAHGSIRCIADSQPLQFSTDGRESSSRAPGRSLKIIAKWEGSALLVNTIVNTQGASYTQMDRWRLSRDGSSLTIEREVVRPSGSIEATLIYEREGHASTPPAPAVQRPVLAAPPAVSTPEASPAPVPAPAVAEPPKPAEYTLDPGTKIPLSLLNSVSTKQSSEGDRLYLVTTFPVSSGGRVIIPPGSYVTGTLTFVKRPARMRGRGELYLRFDSLMLPNGVTRDFRSRLGGLDAETKGDLDRNEGKVKGDSTKGEDARTIGQTTAAGAGIGGLAGAAAGHAGMGVGIGAAAGAAAGVMGVLLSHGPDLVLAKGSSMELVLDRRLVFHEDELVSGWRSAR